MIGMVFDLKRRRTTSFDRREDGVSYLDLVNKGVVEIFMSILNTAL